MQGCYIAKSCACSTPVTIPPILSWCVILDSFLLPLFLPHLCSLSQDMLLGIGIASVVKSIRKKNDGFKFEVRLRPHKVVSRSFLGQPFNFIIENHTHSRPNIAAFFQPILVLQFFRPSLMQWDIGLSMQLTCRTQNLGVLVHITTNNQWPEH